MAFDFLVPTPTGNLQIHAENGTSVIIVGPNGSGKTRLSALLEVNNQRSAHRISAHRALTLNPGIEKIPEDRAITGLKFGNVGGTGSPAPWRWHQDLNVSLLNDFDFLLQVLFAEQNRVSLEYFNSSPPNAARPKTKFGILTEIWKRLLPARELNISSDNITVSIPVPPQTLTDPAIASAAATTGPVPVSATVTGSTGVSTPTGYSANQLSDGERSIFYLVGQVLAAPANSLLIFDEPELHIHPSIMGRLWDEVEAARPDCVFVIITHDLAFAAARAGQKYVIRDYVHTPAQRWTIEPVPHDTGFDEATTTLILGSRKPILFVEGTDTSLDVAIYRACFPGLTVLPRSSCQAVIHSVVTMRANQNLTRIQCAGIVDRDDYDASESAYLQAQGIEVLPVSEIENLFLLPDISRVIAESEGYTGSDLSARMNELASAVFRAITPGAQDAAVLRHCRNRIDRTLKTLSLDNTRDVATLAADYRTKTANLDVAAIAAAKTAILQTAVSNSNLPALLAHYDNKGLLSLAARILKGMGRDDFESWIVRVMRNSTAPAVATAIRTVLPAVTTR